MSTDTKEQLAAFSAFLGETRFRRFAIALQDSRPELYWWQDRVLQQFHDATGTALPQSKQALCRLFDGVIPRYTLTAADVPDWCKIEFLGGECPVQGWGTCDGLRWYFRARSEHWTISVSDGVADPVDIDTRKPGMFFHEEQYGDVTYGSAGSMPEDEARYFIVRELSSYRESKQE